MSQIQKCLCQYNNLREQRKVMWFTRKKSSGRRRSIDTTRNRAAPCVKECLALLSNRGMAIAAFSRTCASVKKYSKYQSYNHTTKLTQNNDVRTDIIVIVERQLIHENGGQLQSSTVLSAQSTAGMHTARHTCTACCAMWAGRCLR